MNIKDYKECKHCIALIKGKCILGFDIEPITFNGCYGDEIYSYMTLDNCPKPMTMRELDEFKKNFTRRE